MKTKIRKTEMVVKANNNIVVIPIEQEFNEVAFRLYQGPNEIVYKSSRIGNVIKTEKEIIVEYAEMLEGSYEVKSIETNEIIASGVVVLEVE